MFMSPYRFTIHTRKPPVFIWILTLNHHINDVWFFDLKVTLTDCLKNINKPPLLPLLREINIKPYPSFTHSLSPPVYQDEFQIERARQDLAAKASQRSN